jgi:hypothetical protein
MIHLFPLRFLVERDLPRAINAPGPDTKVPAYLSSLIYFPAGTRRRLPVDKAAVYYMPPTRLASPPRLAASESPG